jgi:hypothetical protein
LEESFRFEHRLANARKIAAGQLGSPRLIDCWGLRGAGHLKYVSKGVIAKALVRQRRLKKSPLRGKRGAGATGGITGIEELPEGRRSFAHMRRVALGGLRRVSVGGHSHLTSGDDLCK